MDAAASAWFASRTFEADPRPTEQLAAGKGDTRVAVVIPARNEAATIGGIVAAIDGALVQGSGLIDELIVMDSRSSDDTAARARAAGARVHAVDEVRPDLGAYAGKGEAIWKSQFVTDADVLIFIDGDLTSWGLHFVTGLLAPMLAEPGIVLCKGFYDRQFADDLPGVSLAGGRVTELVARPLLNLFWPQLGAVVQPLGGEWAIRRSHLATLAIPVGYGVEFATLVDTWSAHGLDVIAQVDLGERGHTHQAVHDLGVMAAEILTGAARRLGLAPEAAGQLVQFGRGGADRWTERDVPTVERPPWASVERGARC